MGYRVLSLPDPSVPDDTDYTPETLTRRRKHLLKTLERFWKRWKREYLLELREFHRARVQGGTPYSLEKGEVVTVYDEGHPRGLWRLGRIEDLIRSTDGGIRGVLVKVSCKTGHRLLRRPIQHIYPLEVRNNITSKADNVPPSDGLLPDGEEQVSPDTVDTRPVRRTATQARDRIVGWLIED